jgi:hypothetical protein
MQGPFCACGCGGLVRLAKYPSQQRKFINHHQHRGEHNGNFRGGKESKCCPVCLSQFESWPSQPSVTCGDDACYREWQRLKTAARGQHKVSVKCDHCGTGIKLFPSQVKPKNFCNRSCHSRTKKHDNNGNWQGGKWKWFQAQVLRRDDYRCVICGFDQVVDVHHIVGRKRGGSDDPTNLLTLCPNHHRMADIGLIRVEHLARLDWNPEAPDSSSSHSRSESGLIPSVQPVTVPGISRADAP